MADYIPFRKANLEYTEERDEVMQIILGSDYTLANVNISCERMLPSGRMRFVIRDMANQIVVSNAKGRGFKTRDSAERFMKMYLMSDIKIVRIQTDLFEERYAIIDKKTRRVLSLGQGRGFRSWDAAWSYWANYLRYMQR